VAERTAELHVANDELGALHRIATLVAEGVQPQDLFAVVAEQVAHVIDIPLVRVADTNPMARQPSAPARKAGRSSRSASGRRSRARTPSTRAESPGSTHRRLLGLEGEIAEIARRSGFARGRKPHRRGASRLGRSGCLQHGATAGSHRGTTCRLHRAARHRDRSAESARLGRLSDERRRCGAGDAGGGVPAGAISRQSARRSVALARIRRWSSGSSTILRRSWLSVSGGAFRGSRLARWSSTMDWHRRRCIARDARLASREGLGRQRGPLPEPARRAVHVDGGEPDHR
jgi:hypothetical protein